MVAHRCQQTVAGTTYRNDGNLETWETSLENKKKEKENTDRCPPEGILLPYHKLGELDYLLNNFCNLPSVYHSMVLLCSDVFKIK